MWRRGLTGSTYSYVGIKDHTRLVTTPKREETMSVEITDEAIEVLRRSLELGGIDPATGGIRLRGAHGLGGGMSVQVELAAEPLSGEEIVVAAGGVRIFVGPEVKATIPRAIVALEPQHETLVVRAAEGPEE
jgi:hypothetical protein